MPVEPSMPLLISVSDAFASVLHSFASLPQKPRGPEADVIFKKGLKLMADLYASPMGTCVLQNTTVPVRPTEEYGRVFVCGLASPDGAKEAIESMLSRFGAVVAFKRVESERVRLAAGADFEVRFESHQCAIDAVRASQIAGDTHFDRTAEGVGEDFSLSFTFNDLCYHQRGWCVFEEALALECLRHVRTPLHGFDRPKLCELRASEEKLIIIHRVPPRFNSQIDLAAELAKVVFSGKGDQLVVTALLRSYQVRFQESK